jgi:plastocyanin
MTPARRLPLVVLPLLLGAVLALTACGSQSEGASGTAGSGSSTSPPTVTIKNFKFEPKTLRVKVGTKVTFITEDDTTHTATSSEGSTFDSKRLPTNQSYTVTFTTVGTYKYMCDIHQYMTGSIVVQ